MIDARLMQAWMILLVLTLLPGCGPSHHLPVTPPAILVDAETPSASALPSPSPSTESDKPSTETVPSERSAEPLPAENLSLLSAARFALANNHAVRIAQREYDIARGSHERAGGEFDWSLSSNFKISRVLEPLTESEQEYYQALYASRNWDEEFDKYDQSSYSLNVSRKTRWGPEFTQKVSAVHSDDTAFYADAENEGSVMFSVDVPLLRGRGDSTSADERSAAVLAEAAGLEVVHQSSQTIKQVAGLYWDYLAADKYRAIAEASEKRARTMLEETRLLVDAGQQPRASLKQLEANVQDKKATRLARTLGVINARNALGLALGLPVEQFDRLAPPADEFPQPSRRDIDNLTLLSDGLSVTALKRRQDLQAQCKRVNSATILLEAARQNLLPLLNMFGGIGYRGYYEGGGREDLFRSLDGDAADLEWNAGVSLVMPLGNHALKGIFQQRQGQYDQALTRQNQLAANILSAVTTAIATIQSTNAELAASVNAYNSYQLALEDEEEKFRLGLATSLDVMNTEDRLSQANQRVITARSQLAQAVLNLRFVTGRLLETSAGQFLIRDATLESLTFADLASTKPGDDTRTASGVGE